MQIKKMVASATMAIAFMGMALTSASANPIRFADFSLIGSTQSFVFTNLGANSTFGFVGTIPVQFKYDVPNLSPFFENNISGVTMTFTSKVAGLPTGSAVYDQPLKDIQISFKATVGGHVKNLLTVSDLTGSIGASGNLIAVKGAKAVTGQGDNGNGDIVHYTSDYLFFSPIAEEIFSLDFNPTNIKIALAADGYFKTFKTTGSGNFSSDPGPTTGAPEPATTASFGLGGLVLLAMVIRARKTRSTVNSLA